MKNKKILKCQDQESEVIYLDFMPCKKADYEFIYDFYEETGTEFLRIYETDYSRFLLPTVNSFFPMANPVLGELQEKLDVCSDSLIDKKTWNQILDLLGEKAKQSNFDKEKEFYKTFIEWNMKQMTWADVLMIEGNQ